MARLIHYYAHPGHRYSHTNRAMLEATRALAGITRVDLYGEYPRHDIDIDREQERLLGHDLIVLQFPLFWYSSPSLVKEWIDLTFENGFAYGEGGDKLAGKWLMLAITTAGAREGYAVDGHQRHSLRTYLTPFEQTARLSQMRFAAPYVRHSALRTDPVAHASGFATLLTALRDDRYDLGQAESAEIVTVDDLPSFTAGRPK
ncbi:MAG: NAD(P)H-dependent oxidoreductase [Burkholderiaceae bacterium]